MNNEQISATNALTYSELLAEHMSDIEIEKVMKMIDEKIREWPRQIPLSSLFELATVRAVIKGQQQKRKNQK